MVESPRYQESQTLDCFCSLKDTLQELDEDTSRFDQRLVVELFWNVSWVTSTHHNLYEVEAGF